MAQLFMRVEKAETRANAVEKQMLESAKKFARDIAGSLPLLLQLLMSYCWSCWPCAAGDSATGLTPVRRLLLGSSQDEAGRKGCAGPRRLRRTVEARNGRAAAAGEDQRGAPDQLQRSVSMTGGVPFCVPIGAAACPAN